MQNLSNNSADQDVSEINVTPLADVTLVLLIMIMVLSPMALQSMIQVQAAQAVATRRHQRVPTKPIFVDITTKGFTVNNETMDSENDLYKTLQHQLLRREDKTVLISSASDVVYQTVVRVLDIVKQSGAVSLSLVPRKEVGL